MPTEVADAPVELTAELRKAALALPAMVRAKFAQILLDSLEGPADDPEAVKSEWKSEIARRIDDIVSGRVQSLDARESANRLRQRLEERRVQ